MPMGFPLSPILLQFVVSVISEAVETLGYVLGFYVDDGITHGATAAKAWGGLLHGVIACRQAGFLLHVPP